MMNLSFILRSLILLPLVSGQTSTVFNSPSTYFGGESLETDNQAYLGWVDQHGTNYDQSFFLPSTSDDSTGTAVHWRLDGELLHLAVVAKAQGWVAFGFSENGGMSGSDVVYMEAKTPTKLIDAHILDERLPIPDKCQDWTFVASHDNDGFLIFEATRKLDTGDNQDRAIVVNDGHPSTFSSLVIAAWGDTESISNHGPTSRARGQVRWFGTPQANDSAENFQQLMEEQADGYFEHRASDYLISTNETQYVPFCLGREELLAKGVPMEAENLYIIGFEPIVDQRAIAHVHHFTVSADSNQQNEVECSEQGSEISQVYGWAPGELPTALPENVGLPFGDGADVLRLRMVIHYDNPTGVSGVQDSSGVRYYYTTKPREHDLGYMTIGDPLVLTQGMLVGDGLSSHIFECPSTCSRLVLQGERVKVLRQYIHMHKTGIAAQSAQIRDGEVIRTASVDFFAFDQQGNQAVQQEPFEIWPGDSFRLNCVYDAAPDTVFGFASSDEMCMSGFQYYPAKKIFDRAPWICPYNIPFPACNSTYESVSIGKLDQVNRNFGRSDDSSLACGKVDEPIPSAEPADDEVEAGFQFEDEIIQEEEGQGAEISAGFLMPSWSTLRWTLLGLAVYRRTRKRENLIVPLLVEF